MTQIILASSSPYRKQLLGRLNLEFICVSPDIDEKPLEREAPDNLVIRLAQEKAQKVALEYQDSWIIGSDQSAVFYGQLIGKPGSVEAAKSQLKSFNGKEVIFYTSVCLLNRQSEYLETKTTTTKVKFRELTEVEIRDYVAKDNPIDCAGSFKAESIGISLFDAVESKDPTALIGLPLIALCGLLRSAGIY